MVAAWNGVKAESFCVAQSPARGVPAGLRCCSVTGYDLWCLLER